MTKQELKRVRELKSIIVAADKKINRIAEVMDLNARIAAAEKEIKKLKKNCKHENVDIEYGGNTGNYDLYELYWVNVRCPDCDLYDSFDTEKHPDEYNYWCRFKTKK